MELLLSDIPPFHNPSTTFRARFQDLIQEADQLNIASGYISTSSLTDIKKIIELNGGPSLQLLIGMHHFEGFTRTQYEASQSLNNFLKDRNLGQVAVSTVFKFHGKLYSFCKQNTPFAGIVGSSNLNNISDLHRSFEVDLLVDDKDSAAGIDNLINEIYQKAGSPLESYQVGRFREPNQLLEGHLLVEKPSPSEHAKVWASAKNLRFELPIKADEALHSNLNAYFGKGRENKRGFVIPRHWYEVELIVPKEITSHANYPKAGQPGGESVITVHTDDGWKFNCKISGDYSKNFRSEGDLKILGKWLKGRLENSGCLKTGEPVTDKVLQCYGRNTLELRATDNPRIWLIDFGVRP
jgi:hypothetical protein